MKRNTQLYKTIWRWHFYAGLLIAPFLLILAITGGIYVFKPQIEHVLYEEYTDITPGTTKIDADAQVAIVQAEYPEALITSFKPGETDGNSSQIGMTEGDASYTVFLNPYTSEIINKLNNDDRIMDKIEEFHGELMLGTVGDRIVELAACWTLVLIITGAYLWMPRKKKPQLGGTLFVRLDKGKGVLRRDLHAVPAIWLSLGIAFLVATGLPWSGFWGSNFQSAVTNTGHGYPPGIWTGNPPDSITQTKDLAEVPWAAENLQVPESTIIPDFEKVALATVVENAEKRGMATGYSISLPQTVGGVYTVSAFPPRAQDEVTMHMDQYSGAVLTDYRYDNYGTMGKVIAWGITLHKGAQFGLLNQLMSAFICLGVAFLIGSGFYLWWKRKPTKKLGAPQAISARKSYGFMAVLIIMGIIFPLVGLSLIFIFFVDYVLIRRIPKLRAFFNA